jgi:hypothetical protein
MNFIYNKFYIKFSTFLFLDVYMFDNNYEFFVNFFDSNKSLKIKEKV